MKRLYHYPLMLLLTVLEVLSLIGFECSYFAQNVLFKPDIYTAAISDEKIGQVIYDDLCEYFTQFSMPTGIPAEVFTDALDVNYLEQCAKNTISDSLAYLTNPNATKPKIQYDFTSLDNSITTYIETYSDENGIERDDEYQKLLDNTIKTSHEQIITKLDVLLLCQFADSSLAPKLHQYSGYINFAVLCTGAASIFFLLVMIIADIKHPRDLPYWVGTILMCSAVTILIPTIYLKKINYFDSFIIRNMHIYQTVTGLFRRLLDNVINFQFIMLLIGCCFIILTIIIHLFYVRSVRKKAAARYDYDENEESYN